MYTDDIRTITAGLRTLNAKDAEFARGLIRSVESHGFATEKQAHWLGIMAKRASGQPETKVESVGNLSSVYAMFETAKRHLKKPAIVLGYTRAATRSSELTIYVAGPNSSTPGALQVKDADGTWWGRVHQDGTFEHSRRDPPPMGVTDILQRFAANPIGEAAAHGFLTGRCCFCNRKLTDPKSTAVGYGPTCAEHFGLEWGKTIEGVARAVPSAAVPALEAPKPQPEAEPAYGAPMGEYGEGWDALERYHEDHAALDDGPDPEDMAERRAVAGAYAGHYRTGGY